jgi:hypothetical protein
LAGSRRRAAAESGFEQSDDENHFVFYGYVSDALNLSVVFVCLLASEPDLGRHAHVAHPRMRPFFIKSSATPHFSAWKGKTSIVTGRS